MVAQINGTSETSNVDGEPQTSSKLRPLDVIICGAGIGGLTAAIGLRRQGHNVTVYEQSKFANELGAAIHIAPNANGILLKFGLDIAEFGANKMCWFTEYSSTTGEQQRSMHIDKINEKMWQYPWLLAHRIDLHESLKRKASSHSGKGKPVAIITGSKVVDVDCEKASITLNDGQVISGDLVIGADGVHSRARARVVGKEMKPFPSGKSAFRFLLPREVANEEELTKKLAAKDGELAIWMGTDRRIVTYMCRDNKVMNFVCIHPDQETDAGDDWNTGANKKELLDVYKGFPADVMALLAKAEISTLKKWKLLDLEALPNWVKQKCALLGDAAHPFLPHQGQGGAVAIEDAATLAVVLPLGTKPEDIPDRLQLYEDIRKERASTIQQYTRLAGEDLKPGEAPFDMNKFSAYNMGHDEWDNSSDIFRKWQYAHNPSTYMRQPISFGPMPGPRQHWDGSPQATSKETFRTAIVKFKSSKTFLQSLFPTKQFSWQTPGTIAYCSLFVNTIDNMSWLGGSGYSFTGMFIHGVQYTLKDGSTQKGSFMPILWENLTDPIVSGREELGMPKLYCEISIHTRHNAYFMTQSWKSALFGSISLTDLEDGEIPVTPDSEYIDDGELIYKYVPAVGKSMKGKSDVEYAVFIPREGEAKTVDRVVKRTRVTKNAKFSHDGLDWTALPTLHHVVSRLEEMPVFEVLYGAVIEGTGVADVSSAVRIE